MELSRVRARTLRELDDVALDDLEDRAANAAADPDLDVATEGLRVLQLLGARLDVVARQASHRDPRRRSAATTALAGFDPDDTIVDLLAEALDDRNGYVAGAALQVVGHHHLETFAPEVRDLCEDEVWQVRADALRALGRVTDGRADDLDLLREALASDRWPLVRAAALAARQLATPALSGAVSEVLLRHVPPHARPDATRLKTLVQAVTACGPTDEAYEALLHLLTVPTVRTIVATAMAQLGDERAVTPLRTALADPSDRLRLSATRALAVIEGGLDEATLERLWRDPTDAVRLEVITVLHHAERAPDRVWLDRLRTEALGGSATTRPVALRTLLDLTDDLDLAQQLVRDGNARVAAVAAAALEAAGVDPVDRPPTERYAVRRWRLVAEHEVAASSPAEAAHDGLDDGGPGDLVTVGPIGGRADRVLASRWRATPGDDTTTDDDVAAPAERPS
jgi:HEAT repeat protein